MDERMHEKLLKAAFRQSAKTPESWAEKTRALIREKEGMTKRGIKNSRRLMILVLVLALAVPAGVYAGFKLLSPADAALLMERHELAQAFEKEEAEIISKVDGDYMVSLLGMVSGAQLDRFKLEAEDAGERNYVALAVQRTDGKPIENYDEPDISVSPVIEGLDPAHWNTAVFDNGWEKRIQDGVLYCIVDWNDIQMFGYRKMYVAVMEDEYVPSRALLNYDGETGEISENKNYGKVNLLFEIKPDQNKADQKAAEKWIAEKKAEWENDDEGELVFHHDEVTADGISLITRDQWFWENGDKTPYRFNFYVKGEKIKAVYLQCNRGALIEPQRITEEEYNRLEKEYERSEDQLDWYLRRDYENVYRFADYSKAAKRIRVDQTLLTKELYQEESIHGVIDADELPKLEIKITVVKEDGSRMEKTVSVSKLDDDEVIRFKFK